VASTTDRSPTSTRAVLVFVGLQIGMIISTLDGTIVATALPTIARDLGHTTDRSWVVTAFLLGQVATMPLYGRLGDLYGRKRLWLFAISLFTIASMLCGAAQSYGQLVVFRGLQGLGAGGLGVLAMAVVADVVPTRQLGRWLGYQGALFAVASLIGPLAGGLFVDHLSWRWAFYINVPLALVAVAIVVSALRLPYRRTSHAIDYPGSFLLTATLVSVVFVASVGFNVALVAAALVLAAGFVVNERRAREPVVPLHLFASRISRITAGLNFTSGALFASGIYFLPAFWQQVKDLSPTTSGLLLVPFMFMTAGTTLVAGRMVERSGRYRIFPIIGGVVMTIGVGVLATVANDTPAIVAAAFGAVLGAGVGFVMQTSLLALQNSVEHRDLGSATSSALLMRILGSTIGVALWSAVFDARLPNYVTAVRAVYLAAIPMGVVATALALRLPERPLREHAEFAESVVELGS
jgi:EmrB/QacA subfamily drug resistance transporter